MPILGGGASTRAGTVQAWPSNTIPSGWLKCNGAAVSRTLYAALFTEIGTTYGAGDGSTTFNVPDMRGEFLRGLDDGRGIDSGRAIGSSQSDQNQSHAHDFAYALGQTGGTYINRVARATDAGTSAGSGPGSAVGMSNNGGTEARPRNRAMHYIIKF